MKLRLIFICALAFMGQICGLHAETTPPSIIIKFSHVVASDAPKGKAAEMFKRLAEERTQGRVRVDIYPNSQLYKDKDELEALQLGAVQLLAPSLAKFGPLGIKEFEVFDLPYIFPNKKVLRAVTEGPIGQSLLRRLESKGIVGLAFWDNGFKILSANRPIHGPEDLRGLKMRIQSSKVLDSEMRTLSAIPQVMGFSEVYQALQTGVVDGTENPPSNMLTQHMHEVQPYTTLTNHGYLGYAVIANKKFWDGLPMDIRAILESVMAETSRFADTIAQQDNDDAIAAMAASGKTQIYSPSDSELSAWRKALLPVHHAMENRVGRDLIFSIYHEAEKQGVHY